MDNVEIERYLKYTKLYNERLIELKFGPYAYLFDEESTELYNRSCQESNECLKNALQESSDEVYDNLQSYADKTLELLGAIEVNIFQ